MILVATDGGGLVRGEKGEAATELENPGSILTLAYVETLTRPCDA